MEIKPVPKLAIIVPCYREEEMLPITDRELSLLMDRMISGSIISPDSCVVYVDDCSDDSTWQLIRSFASPRVKGIRLSAHVGHQAALLAGLYFMEGDCDAVVSVDADLQDDIEAIPKMVKEYIAGADVVLGVRENRKSDSWLKRNSAGCFYSLMRGLGVNCTDNHADFRLLSARAVKDLNEYGERNVFLRGIVPRLGYHQTTVAYKRNPRVAGKTKYPLGRMIEFAIDGITSFSVRPVRMLFWLGLVFMVVATAIGVYTLIRYFSGETIEGWASLILSIWFCTGLLLMGMGVMGEYIGKIYIEVKHRPRFRIAEQI